VPNPLVNFCQFLHQLGADQLVCQQKMAAPVNLARNSPAAAQLLMPCSALISTICSGRSNYRADVLCIAPNTTTRSQSAAIPTFTPVINTSPFHSSSCLGLP
jgi:hypothetical protein